MGEECGLSVKLFGKTILVVPASKGGDTAAEVCAELRGGSFGGEADELIKDEKSIASSSPVTKSTVTEEENRDSESPEPEAKTGSEGDEEETEDVEEQVQVQPQREDKQEMDEGESQKEEAAVIVDAETGEDGNGEGMATEEKDGKKKPEKPDKNKILPCPRCKSQDTKFCYYNNYNVNQPRHFCRNCQRYWTAGGSMRNVPVGAGRRKSKSAVAEAANVNNSLYIFMLGQHQQQQQQQSFITSEAAALHQRPVSNNRTSTVLSFSNNNPVACFSPAQATLVYSPAAAASTATINTTATLTKNHFSPSYYNAFTNDQTKREPYYYGDQGIINESNPPVHPINAVRYVPWTLPPTYPAEPVPMQLGKHMRDTDNVQVNMKQRPHEEDDDHINTRLWVPKALRITDTPDAAANSSIWTTISQSGLGFNKKEHHEQIGKKMDSSSVERGFFNAFHAKEPPVTTTVATTNNGANDNRGVILFANPAAMARSHQFQETV